MIKIKFQHILLLAAFLLASCAAFFSVSGIAKLFSGAYYSAMFMALSLELGKLVTVSFLYRYWKKSISSLRIYMTIGAVVLMLITSSGIYGYLASAYAKVAATPQALISSVQNYDTQLASLNNSKQRYESEYSALLPRRQQEENRLDSLVARSATGTTYAIKRQQLSIQTIDKQSSQLQKTIDSLSTQIQIAQSQKLQTQTALNTNQDIGTFVYLARILNVSLDSLVKWFILIIVLVFDPLAVAMVIAYNKIVLETTSTFTDVAKSKTISTAEPIQEKTISTPPQSEDSTKIPYYREPDYDYEHDTRWQHDLEAKHFIMNHRLHRS